MERHTFKVTLGDIKVTLADIGLCDCQKAEHVTWAYSESGSFSQAQKWIQEFPEF